MLQRGQLPRVAKVFVLPALLLLFVSGLLYVFSGTSSAESVMRMIPAISKPEIPEWTNSQPPATHTNDYEHSNYEHIETDVPALAHEEHRTSTTSIADNASSDRSSPTLASTPTSRTIKTPKYKPTPTWTPPPVLDTFPFMSNTDGPPPPVPQHNIARPNLHLDYNISSIPPLFIGFTRQWPILLQAVVSYITAGWPASSIIVVENTPTFDANARNKLTLQNPFYLNHTTLRRLGVEVLTTPTLLSFTQLQNFFFTTARARHAQHYFWSHQDVLVFSMEDGADSRHRLGDRPWEFYDKQDEEDTLDPPRAGQPGYMTIYERCIRELNRTLETDHRWAFRYFQYDHLSLVNSEALEAVGGWDPLIPYYMSDCELNGRLQMEGWSMIERRAGLIHDVSSSFEDLAALYRTPGVIPRFVDPNPPPPEEAGPKVTSPPHLPEVAGGADNPDAERLTLHRPPPPAPTQTNGFEGLDGRSIYDDISTSIGYFRLLVDMAMAMNAHKHADKRGRNTWQSSQHGGQGEPYYYDAAGFQRGLDLWTEAGREVFRQKWGERECDWAEGTRLRIGDQWRVERSWED
jgi:hypothetical protein